jgi:peptidoglycan-associated lipoprotein
MSIITPNHRLSSLLLCILLGALTACHTAKLSTALEEIERGEYYKATQTLKQVYRQTDARQEREKRGEVAYYMGQCYERLMIPAQAAASYQNAVRYGYEEPELLLHYAAMRHEEGRYAEAIKLYEQYLEDNPGDARAEQGLFGAQNAAQWKADGSRYEIKRFNWINSRRADFSPALWGTEDEALYYTTSNDKAVGDTKSDITGTKYSDIWVIRKDEKGNWTKPEGAGGGINTEADEGTPCFSPDGNTMFYTLSSGAAGHGTAPAIYASTRSDANWGKGELVKFGGDTLSTFAHPAVSPDGAWLYFVSDMPDGFGGMDLWRAPLKGTEVGPVENLGAAVNTAGNEEFPTFDPNGVLYFSSDGHPGMGGLDLFSARLDDWGTWHVEHLGSPMNSAADDFGMTFRRSTKEQAEGYFSSNRNSGKGYDNIYSFRLPSIKITISGTVYDMDEEPVGEAIVRVVGRNGMNFKSVTKPDGTYQCSIDRSTEYVMMSGKKGYLNRKAQFTSDPEEEDADYEVDFYLPSISEPVLVDNVFYDFNKATLQETSRPALDDLVSLLNDNPYVSIELSAHTDRVGSQNFNLDLAQRRAQTVCDYLVAQGIDPGRLVPKGYGKEHPKVVDEKLHAHYLFLPEGQTLDETFVNSLPTDEQEVADQINRRTEFQVLSTTWGIE